MSTLLADVRYAWRLLMQAPGFSAVTIVTLALGIGANTALFSVVNAVLLRPLPYADPNRLVMVWHENRVQNIDADPMAYETFLDLRRQARSFQSMAGVSPDWNMVAETDEGPEQFPGYFVSSTMFPMLGVQPARGRSFTESEDRQGGEPVAIVSARFWQQRFGDDQVVAGKTIPINGASTAIIGVMPPGFRFMHGHVGRGPVPFEDVDIWMPLAQNPIVGRGRGVRWVSVVGRLGPGVSMAEARAEVASIAGGLARQYPASNANFGAVVVPLREEIVGEVRPALVVLLAAVGLLLLIVCANVANLLLGRASAREREIAIRTALGSSRGRLMRQLLTESVLLALIGGLTGILVATWAVDLLRIAGPADLPRIDEIRIDGVVLAFTLVISLATGILFGLAPAVQAGGGRTIEALKEGGRGIAGGRGRRVRSGLVVAETALALMLLVGAGLLIHSFARLMRVDAGFDPTNVLTLGVGIGGQRFSQEAPRREFFDRLFESLERLPGVQAAGGVTRLPLGSGVTTSLEIEGRGTPEGERPEVEFRRASPDYFRAMGIPVVTGRGFSKQDGPDAPLVALVNEAAVRRFWPGEEVVGKRLRSGGSDPNRPWLTVAGVVGDVRHFGLDQPASAELYVPFAQGPPSGPLLAIRTSTDPAGLAPAVRRAIRELEPTAVISNVATMGERVTESVAQRRFNVWMITLFAGLALTLAAVGIYGVMSFAVAQRLHEIGVRMALGANPHDIVRLIVRQGMGLTLAGVGVGLAASLALTRFLAGLLFGVSPMDPVTFAGVGLLLAGVAVLACYVPAKRATRIDPLQALRAE